MGYMTIACFLNDGLEEFKNHPEEVVKNIIDGGMGIKKYNRYYTRQNVVNSYPVGNHANPMEVAQSFHADSSQVFLAGQNCMTMLTDLRFNDKKDMEFQLKRIQEAKRLIRMTENELKKALMEMKKYEIGMKLKVIYEIRNPVNKNVIFKKDESVTIIHLNDELVRLISDTGNTLTVSLPILRKNYKIMEE